MHKNGEISEEGEENVHCPIILITGAFVSKFIIVYKNRILLSTLLL